MNLKKKIKFLKKEIKKKFNNINNINENDEKIHCKPTGIKIMDKIGLKIIIME